VVYCKIRDMAKKSADIVVNVRMPRELVRRVDVLRKPADRTRSNMMRRLIEIGILSIKMGAPHANERL
jgi:predicted DNA-binding protein